MPLGRPHSAADGKEKGRLAKAGATASGGLVCGLPVSRSLGDGAAKRAAPGVLLPTPDVSSFDISAAQRFVRPPQPPAEMRRDAERRREAPRGAERRREAPRGAERRRLRVAAAPPRR